MVLLASLALGILYTWFFYEHALGLSFPLFALTYAAILCLVTFRRAGRLSATVLVACAGLVLFAGLTAVRAPVVLAILNFVTALMCFAVATALAARPTLSLCVFHWREQWAVLRLPWDTAVGIGVFVGGIGESLHGGRSSGVHRRVLKGLAITLPVLMVMVALFASADLVFGRYVAEIFSLNFDAVPLVRTLQALVVATVVGGLLTCVRLSFHTEPSTGLGAKWRGLGGIELGILLGAVNAVFLGFILIQFAYLFAGQANISGLGFTYAEYARKGFFELIAVTMSSLGLIWCVHLFARSIKSPRTRRVVTGLVLALGLQLGVVMASAFLRLSLYEATFGYTVLRLYSHLFVVALAVCLIIVLIHVLFDIADRYLAAELMAAGALFLMTINILNPDAMIAGRNLDRYRDTGKLDVSYLAGLSGDAVPVVVSRLEASRGSASVAALELYEQERRNKVSGYDPAWQAFNYGRSVESERLGR